MSHGGPPPPDALTLIGVTLLVALPFWVAGGLAMFYALGGSKELRRLKELSKPRPRPEVVRERIWR